MTSRGCFPTIAGEGLSVGRDGGSDVTGDYPGTEPFTFTGGTIRRVAVDVSCEPYVDLEREAQAMMCANRDLNAVLLVANGSIQNKSAPGGASVWIAEAPPYAAVS